MHHAYSTPAMLLGHQLSYSYTCPTFCLLNPPLLFLNSHMLSYPKSAALWATSHSHPFIWTTSVSPATVYHLSGESSPSFALLHLNVLHLSTPFFFWPFFPTFPDCILPPLYLTCTLLWHQTRFWYIFISFFSVLPLCSLPLFFVTFNVLGLWPYNPDTEKWEGRVTYRETVITGCI